MTKEPLFRVVLLATAEVVADCLPLPSAIELADRLTAQGFSVAVDYMTGGSDELSH